MFIETMGQNYLLPWSPKHKSRKMKLKFIQLFENTLDKEVEMVVPLMSSELIEELDYLAYTSVITEINDVYGRVIYVDDFRELERPIAGYFESHRSDLCHI